VATTTAAATITTVNPFSTWHLAFIFNVKLEEEEKIEKKRER